MVDTDIQIIYGNNKSYFDVTDITMQYFLRKDKIVILTNLNINQIYGDPLPKQKKELIFTLGKNKYIFDEQKCKLISPVNIIVPSNILNHYHNISKKFDMSAKYGIADNLSFDVSYSVIRYFLKDNKIIIPANTNFDKYFGKRYFNKPKHLQISLNKSHYIIHNRYNQEFSLELPFNKKLLNVSSSKVKKILILGKGPTAIDIKKSDYPDHIIVGINHAILMIDEVDYFFLNDIESLNGIPKEKFNHIKTIVLPEYPHRKNRADINTTYLTAKNKIDNKNINFEIFNLFTSPKPNHNLIHIDSVKTTTDTAIKYLTLKYGYKHFDLYGICKGSGYHNSIYNNIPLYNKKISRIYNQKRLDSIKNNILKIQKKFKLTITFN